MYFTFHNYLLIKIMVLCWTATETQAANCSTIICYNGGTCNNFTASPPCICPLPFIAPYCIAAADYCQTLQPDKGINELPVCQNKGTCTQTYQDPYFNCTCPSHPYSGIRCNASVPTAVTETTTVSSQSTSQALHTSIATESATTTRPEATVGTETTAPIESTLTTTKANNTVEPFTTPPVKVKDPDVGNRLSQAGIIVIAVIAAIVLAGFIGAAIIWIRFKKPLRNHSQSTVSPESPESPGSPQLNEPPGGSSTQMVKKTAAAELNEVKSIGQGKNTYENFMGQSS